MKRLALVTLMIAALAVGACGKDGGGAGGAGGAAKGSPAAKAAEAAQSVFPQDTKMMIGVSIKQLRDSKLWKQFGEKALTSDSDMKEGMALLKEKCGLDPLALLDSVKIGITSFEPPSMVIVLGGTFDQTKIHDCFKLVAEKEGKKLSIAVDEKTKIAEYSVEGETDKAYAAWLDGAIAFIGDEDKIKDRAALAGLLESKTSIKDNKELSDLLSKTDTGATLFAAGGIAGIPGVDQAAAMAGGEVPTALWGSLSYSKDLKLDLGIRYTTPEAAKKNTDMANAGLTDAKKNPMLAGLIGGIKATFTAEGSDTRAKIEISEKDLDTLVAQATMMLGGMLGGGME